MLYTFRMTLQSTAGVQWESPVSCTVLELPTTRVMPWTGLVWTTEGQGLGSTERQAYMQCYLSSLVRWFEWPANRRWNALTRSPFDAVGSDPLQIRTMLVVHVMHPGSVSVTGANSRRLAYLVEESNNTQAHWELYVEAQPLC